MYKAIISISIIVVLAVVIYFLIDHWQNTVTIYAASCETESGTQLPQSLCKAIVRYRYQQMD